MIPNVWQYIELSFATITNSLPANGLIRIDLVNTAGTKFQDYDRAYFEFTEGWTTGADLRWQSHADGFEITGYGSAISNATPLKFKVKVQFDASADTHGFKVDVYYDEAGTNHWGETADDVTPGLDTADHAAGDPFIVNAINPTPLLQKTTPTFEFDITNVNGITAGAAGYSSRGHMKVDFTNALSFGSGGDNTVDSGATIDIGGGVIDATVSANWDSTKIVGVTLEQSVDLPPLTNNAKFTFSEGDTSSDEIFPNDIGVYYAGGNNVKCELFNDSSAIDVVETAITTFDVRPVVWTTADVTSTVNHADSLTMFKFTLRPAATSTRGDQYVKFSFSSADATTANARFHDDLYDEGTMKDGDAVPVAVFEDGSWTTEISATCKLMKGTNDSVGVRMRAPAILCQIPEIKHTLDTFFYFPMIKSYVSTSVSPEFDVELIVIDSAGKYDKRIGTYGIANSAGDFSAGS